MTPQEIRQEIYSILHKQGLGWTEIKESGLQKLIKKLSVPGEPSRPEPKRDFNNKPDTIRVWREGED